MKIYFGIFGVRLVFLFIFLPSGIIKKNNKPTSGRTRAGHRPGQPLNSTAPSRPSPSAPPRSACAAGAAAAADDPAARGSSRLVFRAEKKEKKIGVRRFSFSRIHSVIFLIAISDPIFVLV